MPPDMNEPFFLLTTHRPVYSSALAPLKQHPRRMLLNDEGVIHITFDVELPGHQTADIRPSDHQPVGPSDRRTVGSLTYINDSVTYYQLYIITVTGQDYAFLPSHQAK